MDTHATEVTEPSDPSDSRPERKPSESTDARPESRSGSSEPVGGHIAGPAPGRIDGPPKNGTPPAKKRGSSQAKKARPIGSPKPPAVRVSLRSSAQRSTFLAVAHRITERDVDIFFDLHKHRILTTHQIVELHFNSPRIATRRLTALREMGFIERFQPHRPTGSNPHHYVLAEPGAFVVAARMGRDFQEFKWTRTDLEQAPFNPHLAHLVEANSFFTRLAWAYRHSGRGQLVEWANGYEPSFRWAVIPDGLGLIQEGRRTLQFAYEHDRGTESGKQLTEKVERYFNLSLAHSDAERRREQTVILFTFPSERREKAARPSFHGSGFPLATGVYSRVMEDPLGRVWLPIVDKVPVRLIDLAYLEPLWDATLSASRGNGAVTADRSASFPPNCFRSMTKTGR